MRNRLHEWWHAKKLTKFGAFLFVIAIIPRWVSIGHFWYAVIQWGWLRASWLATDWGRVCLGVVGVGFIVWDQRRSKRPRSHDLKTLRGRTLALRESLKQFLDSLGPNIPVDMWSDHQVGYIKREDDSESRRVSRLIHGYELHFANDVERTYHEYGEMGYSDTELQAIILRPHKNEECYTVLINALGRLAEQTPIMEARPDLAWSEIANLTIVERREILEGKKPRSR